MLHYFSETIVVLLSNINTKNMSYFVPIYVYMYSGTGVFIQFFLPNTFLSKTQIIWSIYFLWIPQSYIYCKVYATTDLNTHTHTIVSRSTFVTTLIQEKRLYPRTNCLFLSKCHHSFFPVAQFEEIKKSDIDLFLTWYWP